MRKLLAAAALAVLAVACQPQERSADPKLGKDEKPYVLAADELAAGRHISVVGGCNDCHTDGYKMRGEAVAEADRLKGEPLGHYGPWGTTYASNLRIVAANMSEDQWVEMMATRVGRPPMPWEIVHAYSARDMRALYKYIRQLPGEVGAPMPASLPPGAPPTNTPYVDYLTHGGPPPAPPSGEPKR